MYLFRTRQFVQYPNAQCVRDRQINSWAFSGEMSTNMTCSQRPVVKRRFLALVPAQHLPLAARLVPLVQGGTDGSEGKPMTYPHNNNNGDRSLLIAKTIIVAVAKTTRFTPTALRFLHLLVWHRQMCAFSTADFSPYFAFQRGNPGCSPKSTQTVKALSTTINRVFPGLRIGGGGPAEATWQFDRL